MQMRKLDDFISHMLENIHEFILLVSVIAFCIYFGMPGLDQLLTIVTHPVRLSYIERMWLP